MMRPLLLKRIFKSNYNIDVLIVRARIHELESELSNKITFYAQSGVTSVTGGTYTNEGSSTSVTTDHAATTSFTDSQATIQSTVAVPRPMSRLEIRDQSIADFLNKPKLLANINWTTAQTEETVVFNLQEVGYLLTQAPPPVGIGVAEWGSKILGFGLARGTFVLRVQINASPFQAGSLLVHTIPNALAMGASEVTFLRRVNRNLVQKFQHPHILLTTNETACEMRLPFVAGPDYVDLKQLVIAGWGQINVEVCTPLRVGVNSLTYVDVSIYGFWEDFQLAAPTVPQSSSHSRMLRKPVNKIEGTGPITSSLEKVSSVATVFEGIPAISVAAKAVGWAARFASSLTSIFGWSKPILDDKVIPYVNQSMRYAATAEGTDTSLPLSVLHDNLTPAVTDYTMYNCDEMTMKFLGSITHYTKTVTWSTGVVTDTLLLTQNISPSLLVKVATDTVASYTSTYRTGGPIAYLANFFKLWRGSFNLHLKFIKTKFHSGRIQITWTPGSMITTAPTTLNSLYALRHIVDIREQDELVLNLPWLVPAKWLNCDFPESGTSTPNLNQFISGRLDIVVLNDLRAPETCGQTIDMLVSYTAGEDFEFAVPNLVGENSVTGGVPYGVYAPQSGTAVSIIRSGIADSKVEPASIDESAITVGEKIVSLKQMLMRLTFPLTRAAYVWTNTLGHQVNPWWVGAMRMNSTTGALEYPQYYGDALSYIAPMYINFKGSYNVALFTANSNKKIIGCTYPKLPTAGVATMIQDSNVSIGFQDSQTRRVGGFISAAGVQADTSCHYFKVPYYSRYPVSSVRVATSLGGTYQMATAPINTLGLSGPAAFDSGISIARAASDDFQLCMFICAPIILESYGS